MRKQRLLKQGCCGDPQPFAHCALLSGRAAVPPTESEQFRIVLLLLLA